MNTNLQDDPRLRFLARGVGMRLYEGTIQGEGGKCSFLGENETHAAKPLAALMHHQPAAFQPRTKWEHLHFLDDSMRPDIHEDEDEAEASIRTWARNVSPPDDFDQVSDSTWVQHCVDLWNLLRSVQSEQMPSQNFGITAMLHTLCYGISDIVVPCRSNMQFRTPTVYENRPNMLTPGPHHNPFVPDGYSIADGIHCIGYSPQEFRDATYNKRFFVGYCHFSSDAHWTFYIWDKTAAQLITYDTLHDGRRERCQALGVAWRQVLAEMGLPFHFTVYSMPLSNQTNDWDGAIVGLFALFLNLRGLVGLTREDMDRYIPISMGGFGDAFLTPERPFELRHRDWVLEPRAWHPTAESEPIDAKRAYHFIGAAILDELGISDRWFHVQGNFTKLVGYQLASYTQYDEDRVIPKAELYTTFGGYSPITWKGGFVHHLYNERRVIQIPKNGRFAGLYRFSQKMDHSLPKTWPHLSEQIISRFNSRGLKFENGCPVPILPPNYGSIYGSVPTPASIRALIEPLVTTPAPPQTPQLEPMKVPHTGRQSSKSSSRKSAGTGIYDATFDFPSSVVKDANVNTGNSNDGSPTHRRRRSMRLSPEKRKRGVENYPDEDTEKEESISPMSLNDVPMADATAASTTETFAGMVTEAATEPSVSPDASSEADVFVGNYE